MPRKSTIEKMLENSNLSIYEREAAGYINRTRKRNGHPDIKRASALMSCELDIAYIEAKEYVSNVASEAKDIEWNASEGARR